ncbi:MAG: hypothetical protein KA712_08155 [Myxococcales bacterium]|nr:hypothetical protein [Myxococcales bacterium]
MGMLFGFDALPLGDSFHPEFVLLPFSQAKAETAEGGYRITDRASEVGRGLALLAQATRRDGTVELECFDASMSFWTAGAS